MPPNMPGMPPMPACMPGPPPRPPARQHQKLLLMPGMMSPGIYDTPASAAVWLASSRRWSLTAQEAAEDIVVHAAATAAKGAASAKELRSAGIGTVSALLSGAAARHCSMEV